MSAASAMAETGVYLRSFLTPLAGLLDRDDVTDIHINRPGELWIETLGSSACERLAEPRLDAATLDRLARQIAALSHQGISREHPILSASLPDGARVQIVAPPATRGAMAISIRRHVAPSLSLKDYETSGQFTDTAERRSRSSSEISELLGRRCFSAALSVAVRDRRNILVSGGTASGKTTFLNALLREVPADQRIVLIEDTPELDISQENHVGMIAVRGRLGEAQVTANDLVAATLRMRPDRIILGELRGIEAFAFLRAVNSGHPGSMTTIHADSPESAVEQLVLLVLQAGTALSRGDIRHYIHETIDVFVQLGRRAGRRTVDRIVLNAGLSSNAAGSD